MFNKIIIILLLSSFSTVTFAKKNKKIDDRASKLQLIKKIESNYKKMIKENKLSNDRVYLIYLDGARELYSYYFYDLAKKYLEKSLKLKTHHDQSESYSLLSNINRLKKKNELKSTYKRWNKYLDKYPNLKRENQNRLEWVYLLNKFNKKKMSKAQKNLLKNSQLANL